MVPTSRLRAAVLELSDQGVVEYPGDGFSVTKYSKNKKDASVPRLLDDDAGRQHHQRGRLIPDISGLKTTNPVNRRC